MREERYTARVSVGTDGCGMIRDGTDLLVGHALNLRLLEGGHHAVLGREVDDLGVGITEVKLLKQVVCNRFTHNASVA